MCDVVWQGSRTAHCPLGKGNEIPIFLSFCFHVDNGLGLDSVPAAEVVWLENLCKHVAIISLRLSEEEAVTCGSGNR